MTRRADLLAVQTPADLAAFFGMSYSQLSAIIYGSRTNRRYTSFEIQKKSGGIRTIKAPNERLKGLQRTLKDVLYELHTAHPAAHGFLPGHNIKTNARQHVGARYVFNLDLEDYFGTIHFGRVRGLFMKQPFRFKKNVATVLAQICCDGGVLPQGAPTSPILANMVTRRMDAELARLSHINHATYTRYADDLTFSFNCPRARLPHDIVQLKGDEAHAASTLTELIKDEGFVINEKKVRLASRSSRMEVTGLTVNEFPNVGRRFVRETRAMLHNWSQGDPDTELLRFRRFDSRQRRSGRPSDFREVVAGRIEFIRSIRGGRGGVYNRLADEYNRLDPQSPPRFTRMDTRTPSEKAREAVWVLMTKPPGMPHDSQGTAFVIGGGLVVTCAHVLMDLATMRRYATPHLVDPKDPSLRIPLKLIVVDPQTDLAVCETADPDHASTLATRLEFSSIRPEAGLKVLSLGFPNYGPHDPLHETPTVVARPRVSAGVAIFDVTAAQLKGQSGGPVLDSNAELVGIVYRHAHGDGEGSNSAVAAAELLRLLETNQLLERSGVRAALP